MKRFVRTIAGGHFLGKPTGAIIDSFSTKNLMPVFFYPGNARG